MSKYQAPAVIPVMDLMIGQIVLAAGGDRASYRPVHSKLTSDSTPAGVSKALFGQTGCDTLYLADLDSFEGANPNHHVYKQILEPGFRLWIDADWIANQGNIKKLQTDFNPEQIRPIISTETISDLSQLSVVADLVSDGWDPIFSLDIDGDTINSRSSSVSQMSAADLVSAAVEQGARAAIFLNLGAVGTHAGAEKHDQIKQMTEQFEGIEFISGGGIKDAADAETLLSAGCKHVVVASAIHECRFRPDDITALNEYRQNQPVV